MLLLSGCAVPEAGGSLRGRSGSPSPWAEVSISPSLAQRITETIVEIGNLDPAVGGEESEQWLRKTTRFFGGAKRVQWTDTRTCAAAPRMLSTMYDLEMPRPTEGGLIEVSADGALYALSTDGAFADGRLARVSISSSGGTPLADWTERSLAELETCWSDRPPPGMR